MVANNSRTNKKNTRIPEDSHPCVNNYLSRSQLWMVLIIHRGMYAHDMHEGRLRLPLVLALPDRMDTPMHGSTLVWMICEYIYEQETCTDAIAI